MAPLRYEPSPSRKASFLLQACVCLHTGHGTLLSPIGRASQVFGSATSPVEMGSPLTGHRIITRTVSSFLLIGSFNRASVKTTHCRFDAKPPNRGFSGQRVVRVAFRIGLPAHTLLGAKGSVKTANCGIGDFPPKTRSIDGRTMSRGKYAVVGLAIGLGRLDATCREGPKECDTP